MKLFGIKNVDKFFEVVDSCTDKVELVSKDGDRINLKSKLAQYIAIAKIFSNEDIVKELELIAYNQEDILKLIRFMYDGNE
jgi:hypothetical protein